MIKKIIVLLAFLPVFYINVKAQSLIDTGVPDNLFSVGVRAGINTSNINIAKGVFPGWNVNSWGNGFEMGGIISINMRNFFALQPGFFYESRSGDYAYASVDLSGPADNFMDGVQLGHYRNYHFTVPVLAQLRLTLLPGVTWSVDVGPYFSWMIHSKHDEEIEYVDPTLGNQTYIAERNRYDWGLKIGTGINFLTHFYAGLHYKTGFRDVWNSTYLGGKSKVWSFSVGYDF